MQRPPFGPSLSTFLDEEVLPALFERLDAAFPEFGWQRRPQGHWQATNRDFTKSTLGARESRVVASYPFGFKIHGGDFRTWTSYLNGGTTPHGSEFPQVVRQLAERAGVAFPELSWTPEQQQAAQEATRRRNLFEVFWEEARAELHSEAGAPAREYLVSRGFRPDELDSLPLGLFGKPGRLRSVLERHFKREDLEASRLLADPRWEGRLLGAWRDRFGQIQTFWARDLDPQPRAKYLYLDGAPKLGIFGLDVAFRHPAGRDDLVLVEGVFDVVHLQARGFPNVAALGGADLRASDVALLREARVQKLTLALDADDAGRQGTRKAVDLVRKEYDVRNVYVLDVADFEGHKDPDAFVQGRGIDAFRQAIARAPHAYRFLGTEILARRRPPSGWDASDKARDDALRDALTIYEEDTRPETSPLLDRYLIRTVVEETGSANIAWLLEETARRVAEQRSEAEVQRRKDEARGRLAAALRGGLEDLDRSPPDAVTVRLLSDLAGLRDQGDEAPQGFSVARLDAASALLPTGMSSGWRNLDELDVAFHPGELAVLGARTGHGKTSVLIGLLRNWLESAAGEGSDRLFVLYSAEEPEVRIYHRLLALTAATYDAESPWSVNAVRDYLRGDTSEDRWSARDLLEEAKADLRRFERNLLVVYRPGWSIDDIELDARSRQNRQPLGGILVDYLQRIPPPRGSYDRRDIEVSTVARRLKSLAVDLSAPAVTGAQINREAAKLSTLPGGNYDDPDVRSALKRRRPQLHHLREGGSEQEADLVLGLMNYRADFEEDAQEATSIPAVTLLEVGTLKNRYGTPGRWAPLAFAGRYGLVRDPGRHEEL